MIRNALRGQKRPSRFAEQFAQKSEPTGTCPACDEPITAIAADRRRTARPCGHALADYSLTTIMTDQTHDQQHRLLTDGGTVLACPGCDSAAIRSRNTSGAESPNAETAPAYLCTDCGDEFDDVVERAPQAACGLPGLAGTLDQTDPDLVTDGGCE